MTDLKSKQMSPGSHLVYLTNLSATAQNGVTLTRVSIPFGDEKTVCRWTLFGCIEAV